MKQLNFFSEQADQASNKKKREPVTWTLFIDGAARNNPGPAGAGMYLLKDGVVFIKKGYYLGKKTNNQAEYLALLIGLYVLEKYFDAQDTVIVVSDSQLLVRQITGRYKVKSFDLKRLYSCALGYVMRMHARVQHVMREDNVEADKMANHGVDTKQAIPNDFKLMLAHHGISI